MTEISSTTFPDYIRAHELHKRFGLFGRTMWVNLLMSGAIPSRCIGRARIVRISDVEAFLAADRQGAGQTTTPPTG